MTTMIKSLSIGARVMMDLHALNNEGNESNRLMTRQVGIVTPALDEATGESGYARSVVNAISGDMNKHMFADAYHDIALDLGLPLCEACKALDPARMMGNPDFAEWIRSKPSVEEVINRLITCALDDVCGIMITGEGTSVKRKSAVEFGWTVGLPDVTKVEEFIHARHAITRLTRTKAGKGATDEEKAEAARQKEANIGQMIFTRPASSGVYAFVAHLDACAIGFNDATQEYVIDERQRAQRLRAAVLALAQVLLHPKGALTSTQLPHVLDVEGFVSVSQSAAAAPLVSPLMHDYQARAQNYTTLINRLHGENSAYALPFSGQDGLLTQFDALLGDFTPGAYQR